MTDQREPTGEAACPLCGVMVPSWKAPLIEIEMETDTKTCIGCYRSFAEARAEEIGP